LLSKYGSTCGYCGIIFTYDKCHNIDIIDDDLLDGSFYACNICKNMKNTQFSHDGFLEYVQHILINIGLLKGKKNYKIIPNIASASFEYYMSVEIKKFAKTRKKKLFSTDIIKICDEQKWINQNDFRVLQDQCCYLCGKRSSSINRWHNNIIDKKIHSIVCAPGNCLPCCTFCFKVRNELDLRTFIDHLVRISKYNNMIIGDVSTHMNAIIDNINRTNFCKDRVLYT